MVWRRGWLERSKRRRCCREMSDGRRWKSRKRWWRIRRQKDRRWRGTRREDRRRRGTRRWKDNDRGDRRRAESWRRRRRCCELDVGWRWEDRQDQLRRRGQQRRKCPARQYEWRNRRVRRKSRLRERSNSRLCIGRRNAAPGAIEQQKAAATVKRQCHQDDKQ